MPQPADRAAADARREYARKALEAYAVMRRRFHTGGSLYRRDGLLRLPGSHAHLWPFARAVVATLDIAGVDEPLRPGFDAQAEIDDRLAGLERYWDGAATPPGYSSDVIGSVGGGDRYYDDNAWVGLALVQLARTSRQRTGVLERALEVFRFVQAGWDGRSGVPHPGGVFWVEQGRGVGLRNQDRNTVSNAPNAALGLHLTELGQRLDGAPGPEAMYAWVNEALDSGGDGGGLFWDKVRGDETIDKTCWSYNQGSMIGTNVLLHRAADGAGPYLARAETTARRALAEPIDDQPAAFNAIFFRNLLLLHSEIDDTEMRTQITAALRAYADRAWERRRELRGTLLDQSALVQVLALLAGDPDHYGRLA